MRSKGMLRKGRVVATLLIATFTMGACGMMMHHLAHGRVPVPAESEFGLNARPTMNGLYSVAVVSAAPLVKGRLQTVRLEIADQQGAPVSGAAITVDGGMPQHGHGLPTKPRARAASDAGQYVVDGVKFNMGGWWELKFAVSTAAGSDSVTFNIRL